MPLARESVVRLQGPTTPVTTTNDVVGSTKVLTSAPAKGSVTPVTGEEGSRLVGRQLVERQLAVRVSKPRKGGKLKW